MATPTDSATGIPSSVITSLPFQVYRVRSRVTPSLSVYFKAVSRFRFSRFVATAECRKIMANFFLRSPQAWAVALLRVVASMGPSTE